jgi:cytoskeletal protein CcmA (bactofilin family)
MSNPYDKASERVSVIGPTVQFKGELAADEELQIEGRIEGSITRSQRVTIGAKGVVKASVQAQMLVVEGTVEGDLSASKSLVIKPNATVRGNLAAPSVSIHDGATFNGSVSMGAAAAKDKAPADSTFQADLSPVHRTA